MPNWSGGVGGGGTATLLAKLLRQSAPALAEPSPFLSRAPKTSSSTVPRGQLLQERIQKAVTGRALQSPFLFCLKNRFLSQPSLPTPGGIGGSGSRGPAWKARIKE